MIPVVAALWGCGGSKIPVAEVEGTVKVKGQPVEKIMVEFWPVESGVRSFGTTDAQGHFKLTTDDGKRQGAVVGSHKVVLRDAGILGDKFLGRRGEDTDMAQGKKPRISSDYSVPEKTTLNAQVVSGKKNEFDFDVAPFGVSASGAFGGGRAK